MHRVFDWIPRSAVGLGEGIGISDGLSEQVVFYVHAPKVKCLKSYCGGILHSCTISPARKLCTVI